MRAALRLATTSAASPTPAESETRRRFSQRVDSLSVREREVLDGLIAGHANKVIAYDLGISPRTVEVYRANLMHKMQAQSLSELVRMAIAAGADVRPLA